MDLTLGSLLLHSTDGSVFVAVQTQSYSGERVPERSRYPLLNMCQRDLGSSSENQKTAQGPRKERMEITITHELALVSVLILPL